MNESCTVKPSSPKSVAARVFNNVHRHLSLLPPPAPFPQNSPKFDLPVVKIIIPELRYSAQTEKINKSGIPQPKCYFKNLFEERILLKSNTVSLFDIGARIYAFVNYHFPTSNNQNKTKLLKNLVCGQPSMQC